METILVCKLFIIAMYLIANYRVNTPATAKNKLIFAFFGEIALCRPLGLLAIRRHDAFNAFGLDYAGCFIHDAAFAFGIGGGNADA